VPTIVLLGGKLGTGALGLARILQRGGNRRNSNLTVAAIEASNFTGRALDGFRILQSHYPLRCSLFDIAVVQMFRFAYPLRRDDLSMCVMTPEYGGNTQEILSYRDIQVPARATRAPRDKLLRTA
jgi:hypothetical protein